MPLVGAPTRVRLVAAFSAAACWIAAANGRASPDRPAFPFVVGEAPHSVSVGDVQDGRLVRGERLDESDHLKVLPVQKARGYRWGTRELIALLHRIADALHEATDTRLWVGHLSKREGGDIPYSVSHNAGRDADVAYCYRDADGRPVEVDDYIPVFGDGRTAEPGVFLDVPRTWRVVERLATSRNPRVQYLFVARSIETLLLKHAVAQGVPYRSRALAELAMHQPGLGAAKHTDHIHVRLYCSEQDVLAGCRDSGGRAHASLRLYRHRRRRFAAGLEAHLTADSAAQRRLALVRLGVLGAAFLGRRVAERLDDPAPAVQRAAAGALVRLGGAAHLELVRRWLGGLGPAARVEAARAFARHDGDRHAELLAELVEDARGRQAVAIIDAAGRSEHLACVPALVQRLGDGDAAIRSRAARALGRLTGHRFLDDWRAPGADVLARKQARWRSAWSSGRHFTREQWLLRGFRQAGYDVGSFEPDRAWRLVAALSGPEHIAVNAADRLDGLFGRRARGCAGWRSWLAARRNAFGLPPAPPTLCD